jgi:hypothetical protein
VHVSRFCLLLAALVLGAAAGAVGAVAAVYIMRLPLQLNVEAPVSPVIAYPAPIAHPPRPSPVAMDDAAIDAKVSRRAKPAEVRFYVATTMAVGKIYEATLEILRPNVKPSMDEPELAERVTILNKAKASISSAFLKIDRLTDDWQEIPASGRGVWLWRIEPQIPGTAQLVVMVQHAGTFDKVEHVWTVEHFPRTIQIEISWWESAQRTLSDLSPPMQGLTALIGAAVAVSGAAYGSWVWLRKRRRSSGA